MKRLLEAILFAADRPVPVATLMHLLSNSPEESVRTALNELSAEYEESGRSFVLKEVGGGFLMLTHPAFEPWVRKLFKGRLTLRLTKSALETLAIIAYRQPVTKQEIEIIRGVNADAVLHTLLERRLARIAGRKDGVGRPILYGTTREFLTYLGLNDLVELPQIDEMKAILEAREIPASPDAASAAGPFEAPGGTESPGAPSQAGTTGTPDAVGTPAPDDLTGASEVVESDDGNDGEEGDEGGNNGSRTSGG